MQSHCSCTFVCQPLSATLCHSKAGFKGNPRCTPLCLLWICLCCCFPASVCPEDKVSHSCSSTTIFFSDQSFEEACCLQQNSCAQIENKREQINVSAMNGTNRWKQIDCKILEILCNVTALTICLKNPVTSNSVQVAGAIVRTDSEITEHSND